MSGVLTPPGMLGERGGVILHWVWSRWQRRPTVKLSVCLHCNQLPMGMVAHRLLPRIRLSSRCSHHQKGNIAQRLLPRIRLSCSRPCIAWEVLALCSAKVKQAMCCAMQRSVYAAVRLLRIWKAECR